MIVIGGVAGNFLPIAKANPKQHAIAIVLGRLMMYGIVHALPLRTIEGFFTQLALADVELGQKYHNKAAVAVFGGIARELCGEILCARFWDAPINLQHPSAWRVIWDGITILNGSTLCVILIAFTDRYGSIVCEFVSAPVSTGGTGPQTAKLILDQLEQYLHVTSQRPQCRSSSGLPLGGGGGGNRDAADPIFSPLSSQTVPIPDLLATKQIWS